MPASAARTVRTQSTTTPPIPANAVPRPTNRAALRSLRVVDLEGRPPGLPTFYLYVGGRHPHRPYHRPEHNTYIYLYDPTVEGKTEVLSETAQFAPPRGSSDQNANPNLRGLLSLKPGDWILARDISSNGAAKNDVPKVIIAEDGDHLNAKREALSVARDAMLGPRESRTVDKIAFETTRCAKGIRGSRCYTMGPSLQHANRTLGPAAAFKFEKGGEEFDEPLSMAHEFIKSSSAYACAAWEHEIPAFIRTPLKARHDRIGAPTTGVPENYVWSTFQMNTAPAQSIDCEYELSKEMGPFGKKHIDTGDSVPIFSSMTVLSDLPSSPGWEAGRIHFVDIGAYVVLDPFIVIFFSGLHPHGGSPPLAPSGEEVPPWAYRLVVIGYPPTMSSDGDVKYPLARLPNGKTLYITQEMLGIQSRSNVPSSSSTTSNMAKEGAVIMAPESHFRFFVRSLLVLVVYLLGQLPARYNVRVDKERFLSAFTMSDENGDEISVDQWDLGPSSDVANPFASLAQSRAITNVSVRLYNRIVKTIPYKGGRPPKKISDSTDTVSIDPRYSEEPGEKSPAVGQDTNDVEPVRKRRREDSDRSIDDYDVHDAMDIPRDETIPSRNSDSGRDATIRSPTDPVNSPHTSASAIDDPPPTTASASPLTTVDQIDYQQSTPVCTIAESSLGLVDNAVDTSSTLGDSMTGPSSASAAAFGQMPPAVRNAVVSKRRSNGLSNFVRSLSTPMISSAVDSIASAQRQISVIDVKAMQAALRDIQTSGQVATHDSNVLQNRLLNFASLRELTNGADTFTSTCRQQIMLQESTTCIELYNQCDRYLHGISGTAIDAISIDDADWLMRIIVRIYILVRSGLPVNLSSSDYIPNQPTRRYADYRGPIKGRRYQSHTELSTEVRKQVSQVIQQWFSVSDQFKMRAQARFVAILVERLGSGVLLLPHVWAVYNDMPVWLFSADTPQRRAWAVFKPEYLDLLEENLRLSVSSSSCENRALYDYLHVLHTAVVVPAPPVGNPVDNTVPKPSISLVVQFLLDAQQIALLGASEDAPPAHRLLADLDDYYMPLRESTVARRMIHSSFTPTFLITRSGLFSLLVFRNIFFNSGAFRHSPAHLRRLCFHSLGDFRDHMEEVKAHFVDKPYKHYPDFYCNRRAYGQTIVERTLESDELLWRVSQECQWPPSVIPLPFSDAMEWICGVKKVFAIAGFGALGQYSFVADLCGLQLVTLPSADEMGHVIKSLGLGSLAGLRLLRYHTDDDSSADASVSRGFASFVSDVDHALRSYPAVRTLWNPITAEHTLCKVTRMAKKGYYNEFQ